MPAYNPALSKISINSSKGFCFAAVIQAQSRKCPGCKTAANFDSSWQELLNGRAQWCSPSVTHVQRSSSATCIAGFIVLHWWWFLKANNDEENHCAVFFVFHLK